MVDLKCTRQQAKDLVRNAQEDAEPPLLPRVFLRARELGASPAAEELLSQVAIVLGTAVPAAIALTPSLALSQSCALLVHAGAF